MEKKIISEIPKEMLNKKNRLLFDTYDACIAIPYGKKCLLWIREIEDKEYCFFCELDSEKKIVKVEKKLISFNSDLVGGIGTILYCTINNRKDKKNKMSIIVEDIYYYKGDNKIECTFKNKLAIYKKLFYEDINKSDYDELYIKLVEIRHTFDEIKFNLLNIPYDIYSIKYVEMKSNRVRMIVSKNIPELCKVKLNFIVYRLPKCEYYELYVLDNNKEILYDKLYVKTIEQSKLMENMFSDNSRVILECFYDKKKGWVPNKKTSNRIANLGDIRTF